jgi:8-oxo-dGTP pyrophosphatase MutT (NUDIX family)
MNISLRTIQTIISQHHGKKIAQTGARHASVLVPLVYRENQLDLLLTKRTDSVEHHKGQVSFPGGMVEQTDESLECTALRETEEEIGIPPSSVSVIGMLDDIHIPTGFVVTPVVGYIEHLPGLHLNCDEVAEVFYIPLKNFFDHTLRRSEIRELLGIRHEVYFYDVWKEPVWGATAHIIKEFVDLIQSSNQ